MAERKPLKLIQGHGAIGGVCSGIAYAFGWPVTIVRIVAIISFILGVGVPFVLYIGIYFLLALLGEEWDPDPKDYEARTAQV